MRQENESNLKILIRCLPFDMQEGDFIQKFCGGDIDAHVHNDIRWFWFVGGGKKNHLDDTVTPDHSDSSAVKHKQRFPRSAYALIVFSNCKAVESFVVRNNGRVLQDKDGNSHITHIEYAPVQKLPKQGTVDLIRSKTGTTYNEPVDFLHFRDNLNTSTRAHQYINKSSEELGENKKRIIDWLGIKLKKHGSSSDLVDSLAMRWRREAQKAPESKPRKKLGNSEEGNDTHQDRKVTATRKVQSKKIKRKKKKSMEKGRYSGVG